MLTALAVNCIIEHKAQIAKKAVSFFLDRADDWRYVIPEANDCLRECQNFCYIIDPVYRQEQMLKHKTEYSHENGAANSATTRLGTPSSGQNGTAVLSNDSGIVNEIDPSDKAEAEANQLNPEAVMQPADECLAGLAPIGDNGKSKQDQEQLYGAQAIVREIVQRIEEAQGVLEAFLYESKRDKNFFEEIKWTLKRSHIAAKLTGDSDYREYFRTTSTDIRRLLNNLMLCQKLTDHAAQPKLDWFKKDMTEEAYLFWKMHIGQRIIAPWKQFIDAYILLYGTVDPVDLKYIETVLLSGGNKKLTVHGFINFTNQHSFPFPKSIATTSPRIETPISEQGRMDLTKMVMSLVTDFSSNEMRAHLLNLYTWYSGYKSTDEIQKRANEWAYLVKKMRDTKEKNPKGEYEEAEKVDMARRAIYFFYQRFMVMWRVGQVSRETLNNVDFPGKGRIADFIRYVGPLDRANYYIVMGKGDDQWKEHKPQIYKFLEQYLTMLGDTSLRKQDAPNILDGPTQGAPKPTSINGTNDPIRIHSSELHMIESVNINTSELPSEQDVDSTAVADNN